MNPMVALSEALADAEVFTDGDWVESKDQDPNGNVRLVQLADVGDGTWVNRSERFLTSAKAKELRCTFLKEGDVLIARMPDPLGRSCVFPGDQTPCVTVVDVCVIRPNPTAVDNRYLMHAINAPVGRRAIARHVTGTTRSRISRRNLGKVEIPLPPLSEQKRIAAILDAADELRAKRRKSIDELDTLLQATFLDMFGDPVVNPKRWDVRPLGELAKNEDGLRIPVKSSDRANMSGEYPYYGASGVIDSVDDFLFEGHRLLVAEDGANLISRSSPIAFIATGRYWVNNHAHVLGDNGQADLTYLREFFSLADLQPYITGSAQPKLNQKNLNRIQVPTPPREKQEAFKAFSDSIAARRQQMICHLSLLDSLFDSLQSRAFKGEL